MNLRSLTIAGLLLLACAGCGEGSAYVANAVDLRVQFSDKLVSVHFVLDPAYAIKQDARISFNDFDSALSTVFVRYPEPPGNNEIGAIFSARAMVDHAWPTEDFRAFPNGHKLPKSIPSGSILKSLSKTEDNLTVQSLHQSDPMLIIGGSLLSPEFSHLPLGFLATQLFKDEYGNIIASISVTGPTLLSKGGLYFFANFGLNPFVIKDLRHNLHIHGIPEPMTIIRYGRGTFDFLSLSALISSFTQRLSIFSPQ